MNFTCNGNVRPFKYRLSEFSKSVDGGNFSAIEVWSRLLSSGRKLGHHLQDTCERKKRAGGAQQRGAAENRRCGEIDHSPSAMHGRDGPAPPRPQDYSGRPHVADDRRRGASLIPLTPEVAAADRRIARYPRMRSALAAGASRKHLALLLVALHHGIDQPARPTIQTSVPESRSRIVEKRPDFFVFSSSLLLFTLLLLTTAVGSGKPAAVDNNRPNSDFPLRQLLAGLSEASSSQPRRSSSQ